MKYICVSGGADSTAMALLAWERGEDFEMVFADTGAELPEVYWFLPKLQLFCKKPLRVVSNGSFFQHLVQFKYFYPSMRIRWCTRLLKQVPQDRFFKNVNADEVCVGIRADEPRRLNNPKFIYPLAQAGMGKRDVHELCKKYNLLNPVYSWRSSVSCFCCFFQRKSDWLGLLKHHPTLYEIAANWENTRNTEQLFKINIRFTLDELRKANQRQLALWPEPEEEPCLICSS